MHHHKRLSRRQLLIKLPTRTRKRRHTPKITLHISLHISQPLNRTIQTLDRLRATTANISGRLHNRVVVIRAVFGTDTVGEGEEAEAAACERVAEGVGFCGTGGDIGEDVGGAEGEGEGCLEVWEGWHMLGNGVSVGCPWVREREGWERTVDCCGMCLYLSLVSWVQ